MLRSQRRVRSPRRQVLAFGLPVLASLVGAACTAAGPAAAPATAPAKIDQAQSASKTAGGAASVSVSGVGPGLVQPKPAGATQVNVRIGEWFITLAQPRVKAGEIYFLVDNVGADDPHELVVIKDDRPPDQLPVVGGRVPEEQVNFIGEVEAFAPKTVASGTFTLPAGNYALICNIAELEGGELESHYLEGMRTRFVVE